MRGVYGFPQCSASVEEFVDGVAVGSSDKQSLWRATATPRNNGTYLFESFRKPALTSSSNTSVIPASERIV